MLFRTTLVLVLLVAAAGGQIYTPPEAEAAAAEAAPAVETVEEAVPATEEVLVEEPAPEEAPEGTPEEAPEETPEETSDEAPEETVVEASEETVVEAKEAPESAAVTAEAAAAVTAAEAAPEPASDQPTPSYHQSREPTDPACALNTTKPWCLEDSEYPAYQISQAIGYHHYSFLALYQDVVANTSNSVARLQTLEEETYLCGSQVSYVQPLRARNTDGRWRVIVNGITVHYDTFTQTARLEECQQAGQPCPLVPECYESACLQQSGYQRFLVYDAKDYYQPFAVETFRLPTACACALGAYEITH